jgi:hypothetical protein
MISETTKQSGHGFRRVQKALDLNPVIGECVAICMSSQNPVLNRIAGVGGAPSRVCWCSLGYLDRNVNKSKNI